MLNLGSITFGINADTSGLQRAQQNLQNFGQRLDNALRANARGADYNIAALQRQEGAAVRALQRVQSLTTQLNNMRLDPQVRTEGLERLERAYSDLVSRLNTRADRPLSGVVFQRATLGFKEQLDAINRAMRSEQQQADTTAKSVAAALQQQELAAMRASHQVEMLNDQIARLRGAGSLTGRQADSFNSQALAALSRFQGTVGGGNALNPQQMLQAQLQMRGALTNIQRDMAMTARAAGPVRAAIAGIGSAFELGVGPLNGFVFRLRAANMLIKDHGVLLGGATAAVIGFGTATAFLAHEIINTVVAYQKTEMALKGITDSSAIATAEITVLRDIANQAGLSFTDIAPAFSRFVSSASGAGQSLEVTNDEFRKFAMLAGTLHLSTEEVNNTLRAFDQMLSMGRVQAQEMRQLFNQLPAVFEIASMAAKNMGVDLRDAMKKGELSAGPFLKEFLNVAQTMFHIDLSKPIDSLQASLTRMQTTWQVFILELDRAIAASPKFQEAFESISRAITWASQHLNELLGILGAVGGALLGIAAAQALIAIFSALNIVITTAVGLWTTFRSALALAQTATELLTAAQIGLNVAVAANPIGAFITIVLSLIGAIVGATMAMDMMNRSVVQNQSAMNDTSSIDAYIAKQQSLGKNINSVTQAMLHQIEVMQEANFAKGQQALQDLGRYQAGLAGMRAIPGGTVSAYVGGMKEFGTMNPNKILQGYEDRVKETERLYANIAKEDARLHGVTSRLHNLQKLPNDEGTATGNGTGGGHKGRKPPDPERGLRGLQAIVLAANSAQLALDNMWAGPQNPTLIKALDEARNKLFNLDKDQLATLDKLMASPQGVEAIDDRTAKLTAFIMKTELAEDTLKEFNRVWDTIRQGTIELGYLNKQLDLIKGGANPNQFWFVDAIKQADEALRKLQVGDLQDLKTTLEQLNLPKAQADEIFATAGQDRTKALQATVKALKDMGVQFAETGDAATDAHNGMTQLFASLQTGTAWVQRFTQAWGELDRITVQLDELNTRLNYFKAGGNPNQMWFVEGAIQARQVIRALTDNDLQGLKSMLDQLKVPEEFKKTILADAGNNKGRALEGLLASMEAMGISVKRTGDDAKDAETALAQLYGTLNAGQAVLAQVADSWNTLHDLVMQNATALDKAKDRFRDLQAAADLGDSGAIAGLEAINAQLEQFGVTTGTTAERWAEVQTKLEIRNEVISTWVDFGNAAAENLGKTLAGMQNFADMSKAILGDLKQALINTFVVNPLKRWVTDFVAGMFPQLGGLLQSPEGATKANTTATALNTMALNRLTTTIASSAMTGGAGGSGGFLSTLFNVGMNFFAPGSGSFGSSFGSSLASLGGMLGRGVGGPMLAGTGYSIGEPGAGLEVFVPGSTGRMYNQDQLGGLFGGGGSNVDASTNITIHGNVDRDVYNELVSHIERRDAQLRAELPYLIDNRNIDSRLRGRNKV